MSSPIAHAAAGYAVYRAFRNALPQTRVLGVPPRTAWVLIALFCSLLPDADAVAGWALGSLERYHNNLSHSLLFCLAAAALLALPLQRWTSASYRLGFAFTLSCLLAHLAIDGLTHGRGLMLLWPLTEHRFASPAALFLGVPWSAPWTSPLYGRMLLEDSCFAAVVLGIMILIGRRKRTS